MTRETKLRLLGGCILLFNLILIGSYDLQGLPVLLLTFGFAAGYEFLVVRRGRLAQRETVASTDDQSLYEQAASEIRDRRAVKAIWAKAFAEADGDQKRTMARYITLRAKQIKAEQQAEAGQAKSSDKPKPRWRGLVLQSIVIFLLVKLVGLLPAVLASLSYAWLIRRHTAAIAVAGAGVVGLFLTFAVHYLLPSDAKLKPESSAQHSSEADHPNYIENNTEWQKRVKDIREAAEHGTIPISHLLTTGSHKDLVPGSYHAALLSEQTQTWWKTESEFFIYFNNPASYAVRALEFSYSYGECSPDIKGETYTAELEKPISGNSASLIIFPSIDKEHQKGCLTVLRIYH